MVADNTQTILNDVGYTLTGIAGAMTLGRFYVRWRYSKLSWDDLFNGLALACILVQTPLSAYDNDPTSVVTWRFYTATIFLIWTTLWCVKASFLALLWAIFKVSPNFRKAWWFVTVYVALSYWPVLLIHLWNCGQPSDYDNPAACMSYTPSTSNTYVWVALTAMEAALHVSSELFILALPLIFIKNLQMTRAQKINAGGIFGVVLITITAGALRTMAYVCVLAGFNADTSNVIQDCMGSIEPPLAVIVCTLPAYKGLMANLSKRRREAAESQEDRARQQLLQRERSEPKRTTETQDSIAELEFA